MARRLLFAGALSASAIVLTGLAVDAERLKPFMPPCVFHEATGLYCPGCGGTRALIALLHGRLLDAMHDNVLIFLGGAVALWTAWRMAVCIATGAWIPPRTSDRRVSTAIAILFIAFFVLRNIPVWPLTLLAPLPR